MARSGKPLVVVVCCAKCQRWNRKPPALAVVARPADARLPDQYGWAAWAVDRHGELDAVPGLISSHPAWPDADLRSIGRAFAPQLATLLDSLPSARIHLNRILHNPAQFECHYCGPRRPVNMARLVGVARAARGRLAYV